MADGMSDEALRIADYFDTGYGHFGERKRAAALLRQQQAEIDRLTEKCDWLLSTPPYHSGYFNGFKAGIAFATRRINGMQNHQDGFSRGEVLRAIDDKIRGEK